jgi:hypothetical protein
VKVGDAQQALVAQLCRESRGLALRKTVGRHWAGDVLAVADRLGEHAAQARLRQRRGVTGNAACVLDDGRRAGADGLERADGHHQRRFLTLQQARRLNREPRRVREAEVFVEAAREGRREVGVTIDETGEQRLASAVVHRGVLIRLQDRVGGPDRDDAVGVDRERDVLQHGVDVDDGRVGEHRRLPLRRLRLRAAPVDQQRGGAGSGPCQ